MALPFSNVNDVSIRGQARSGQPIDFSQDVNGLAISVAQQQALACLDECGNQSSITATPIPFLMALLLESSPGWVVQHHMLEEDEIVERLRLHDPTAVPELLEHYVGSCIMTGRPFRLASRELVEAFERLISPSSPSQCWKRLAEYHAVDRQPTSEFSAFMAFGELSLKGSETLTSPSGEQWMPLKGGKRPLIEDQVHDSVTAKHRKFGRANDTLSHPLLTPAPADPVNPILSAGDTDSPSEARKQRRTRHLGAPAWCGSARRHAEKHTPAVKTIEPAHSRRDGYDVMASWCRLSMAPPTSPDPVSSRLFAKHRDVLAADYLGANPAYDGYTGMQTSTTGK